MSAKLPGLTKGAKPLCTPGHPTDDMMSLDDVAFWEKTQGLNRVVQGCHCTRKQLQSGDKKTQKNYH